MMDWISSFLASGIRMATPLLIASLGMVFSAKAGIVNIGTEGFMLMGALTGVIGSHLTGSALFGALFAMLCTMLLAAVFAFFTMTIKADQTVVGAAINIFASGFTITLNRVVFDPSNPAQVSGFNAVPIPVLSKIPVIGPALFNQPLLCYAAFVCVPLAWYIMNKTHVGLRIRAAGESPQACDTLGINVNRVRWLAILYSGLLAGLGGAFVSMGLLNAFLENMIAGRGFMVLAAVVFGNYSPVGVMWASLIFGAGNALTYRLQAANVGIPYQLANMLPYVISILAVCGMFKKSRSPAASGVPYSKE